MENARMNYYFTGIIILMLTALAFCTTPAYPRNEYLNNSDRCGEFEARIEQYQNDTNYNSSNSTDYNNENWRFNLGFRKYLGTDCKTSKENMQLKQQLELMKMCNKVNRNPSLAQNPNFTLLVSKCRGVVPQVDEIESMALNKVNIEFLTKQMDKVLTDIESLKDKARDMHYKNGNGQ